MCTCILGQVETAQLLVKKGADINIIDNKGVRVGVCITDCVLVLLTIGYYVHECVTNPQSLVS